MNLFSKTWSRDFPWIELAIYSVLKHCTEPVNWYVAVERLDRASLDEVIMRARGHFPQRQGDSFKTFDSEIMWPESQNIVDGYMRQQWIKMNIHRIIHNHIAWNWDSDVIAKRPFDSTSFMRNGKPVVWWDDMNHLINGGYPASRKSFLMDVFGSDVGREYMRCMPIALHGEVLESGSKSDIWSKAFNACSGNNRDMTEFNVIGEYGFRHFNERFSWINAQNNGPTWQGEVNDPEKITYQAWSWGGVNDGIRNMVLS